MTSASACADASPTPRQPAQPHRILPVHRSPGASARPNIPTGHRATGQPTRLVGTEPVRQLVPARPLHHSRRRRSPSHQPLNTAPNSYRPRVALHPRAVNALLRPGIRQHRAPGRRARGWADRSPTQRNSGKGSSGVRTQPPVPADAQLESRYRSPYQPPKAQLRLPPHPPPPTVGLSIGRHGPPLPRGAIDVSGPSLLVAQGWSCAPASATGACCPRTTSDCHCPYKIADHR